MLTRCSSSDALKTGPAHDLFAYIAKSIGTFLKDYGDQEDCANATREDPLLVGFTFSFVSAVAAEQHTTA
jgi:hexokinase